MSLAQLHAYNHTELYQLGRRAGLLVTPSMSREELIAEFTRDTPMPLGITNPMDSWRNGLAGFVMDYWSKLQNQVTCPLKSKDPKSCFGCLDMQVITCITNNPSNEEVIRRYNK